MITFYADDTQFFKRTKQCMLRLVKTFKKFSSFSDLKPNFKELAFAGTGLFQGVKMVASGMK